MPKMDKIEQQKRMKQATEYYEKMVAIKKEARKELGEKERSFVYNCVEYGERKSEDYTRKLAVGLREGKYKKPSEFFLEECGWLFGTIIYDCHKDAFLYQVDNCMKYPYTRGWLRRPFRSEKTDDYLDHIKELVSAFYCQYIPKTPSDYLSGNLTADEQNYYDCYKGLSEFSTSQLAYDIDMGNEAVITAVKDSLMSGSTTDFSYEIIRAVFKSSNKELYKAAGDLLLAAKLQEGVRQAICENCDEGVLDAYIYILSVINDNDLIRYSAVKRAVGTWTGILSSDSKELERISGKELKLIVDCLSDEKFREECIASDDAMKLFTGLWSLACVNTQICEKRILDIVAEKNQHRTLVAAFFARELGFQAHKLGVQLAIKCSEMTDVMAVIVPSIHNASQMDVNAVNEGEGDELVKDYYGSREDANALYDALLGLYKSVPKKSIDFYPCVFPWNEEKLTKSDLIGAMCLIAGALGDDEKIDFVCTRLADIDISNYGTRRDELKLLLTNPRTEVQMKALISECADKESYTRCAAFAIAEKLPLKPEHFLMFEDMLRYKTAEIRSKVIGILMKLEPEQLCQCIQRLVTDKKEEKRTAGLDIMLQAMKDEKFSGITEKFAEFAALIPSPTSKEKILIDQICSNDNGSGDSQEGFGLYTSAADYTPVVDEKRLSEFTATFAKYFPNSAFVEGQGDDSDLPEYVKKLDAYIEEHKNTEYRNYSGEEVLLGSGSSISVYGKVQLTELWDAFYAENINDPILIERLFVYSVTSAKPENFTEIKRKMYGEQYVIPTEAVYGGKIRDIIEYLNNKFRNREDVPALYFSTEKFILEYPDTKELFCTEDAPSYYSDMKSTACIDGELVTYTGKYLNTASSFNVLPTMAGGRYPDDSLDFAIDYKLTEKFGYFGLIKNNIDVTSSTYKDKYVFMDLPGITPHLRAAYRGEITSEYLYKMLFEHFRLKNVLEKLSGIVSGYRELELKQTSRIRYARNVNQLLDYLHTTGDAATFKLNDQQRKMAEFAVDVYNTITAIVLDSELKRGDSPARFSKDVSGLQIIYGAERMVKILAALGRDTLTRIGYYSYSDDNSKKDNLSHLLWVCYPEEGDNAEKLAALLKETDVTEKRLVEAALFAPQWMDIVGEYLGWEGFKSTCYYFIAHMNEYSDPAKEAVIAKYTPISGEDLRDGAFDTEWFREAYETIGQEHFEMIYDAAKYISDGAKHSRARKYADAVMGKLSKEEAVKNITEKRNKDTLMAYSLIPLEGEDDMVERYLLLQQFLKESKKFGAQRKASESKAVDIAMQNMAKTAGFADVTRLTLRMETKLFDNIRELTEFNTVGDVAVRLAIDEDGNTSIECTKNGKALKSVPAKYKKDELIIRLNDVKKQLTEQRRRTKLMLEQSMEDRISFKASELDALSDNPVAAPLVSALVYVSGKDIGFLREMKLVSPDGKSKKLKADSDLFIAHPLDLYNAGIWQDYQKYLFDQQITQPFKQVFRELYVKTAEEMERMNSLRYAGNQIQPRQAAACLKARRWVADVDSGLQKIYYKENIIARIYALADWFSPSEVEAPTLEWVDFVDRKTGKSIKIADIPDLIFSEVMRDVDLAVSVAHAGGVDPETSHSTMEMRTALCQFTMPLFKLTNVTFDKSHAFITGTRADYTIHMGSGVVHIQGGPMINILPVHSQHRGKLFLPFADEDPKTAQIISEILLFADDAKIKDPFILEQIK